MIISTTPGFIKQNYIGNDYVVRDTSLTSPNYFDITFFPEVIGGGVSLIKLRGNPSNLLANKLTEIEILDALGNPVRYDIPTYVDRFENYYVSIEVYDTVAPGRGTVSFVGVATRDLQGNPIDPSIVNDLGHNVIWTRPITILPYERNNSELVFDDPPFVSVAQVVTPARVSYQQNVDTQYSAISSSALTITTSNFKGFDKKQGSNFKLKAGKLVKAVTNKITDSRIRQISTNPNSDPYTVNTVNTTTRTVDADVVGGFILNENNRYNTTVQSNIDFFSSSYVGATIEFFTASYTLNPPIPSAYSYSNTNPYDDLETILPTTQSRDEQLGRWTATVVRVKDHRTAFLDRPVQADLKRTVATTNTLADRITHTYKQVTNFTASLLYTPNTNLYTTSSEVSQSYIQFTMQDVRPIGGEVYKIRAYYRRGSEVGDWSLLQDQIIFPVEYLTDARYPNQTNYAADVSDFLLLGHFTQPTILTDNWNAFNEQTTTFDTATASLDSSVLLDSVKLTASASLNKILTTKYYQNYPNNAIMSLTFNCALEPNTILEVYQNSSPLQTTVFASDPFPRAFDKTLNYEPSKYSDRYNRYGKLIGKISNTSTLAKDYQRVIFDFKTDSEGLGRPLFRVKQIDTNVTASAYVAEVSITPRKLNGFTPSTLQFAFPAKLDTNIYLSESIDYKLEYYDYTGNQSEYVTYLDNVVMELATEIPTNACQAEQASFEFTPPYWIRATSGNPHNQIVSTQQMLSQSWTSNDHWYPAVTNVGVPAIIDLSSGLPASYGNTPVDGWNCNMTINNIVYSTAASASFYAQSGPLVIDVNGGGTATIFTNMGSPTSSWQYIDPFVIGYQTSYTYSDPIDAVYAYASPSTSLASVNIDNIPNITSGSCVGIAKNLVQSSYTDFASATTNANRTIALKKRRLMYPIQPSLTGSYFTENGGIYNVKFRLKKATSTLSKVYEPDSNSYLMVYIFNANANYTAGNAGTAGWYPPSQNIVKIGNAYSVGGITTPAISYFDSATGYYYDEYNINLVQYGTPAQLVFEPSGDNGAYFGTLVDNISFCKIGVTHDPYYIKPASVASGKTIAKLPADQVPSKLGFG